MKHLVPLFGNSDGSDPMYNSLRSPSAEGLDVYEVLARGRTFSEELWLRTAEFLDADLPDKAQRHFHQCFWEMYVAASLLDTGLPLLPRPTRTRQSVGPDLHIAPNIWIEAIAVSAGAGPDAVPDSSSYADGTAFDVPDQQMKLRLIAGITEKRNKFEVYKAKGVVGPSDVCVVAINSALIPHHPDFSPPRIVRALMEFGFPVAVIDLTSNSIAEWTHEHRPTITKRSHNTVGQGLFRDGSCSGVSACIHSSTHYGAPPHMLGVDFKLVHNATAAVPLQRELIARADEYWIEGSELVTRNAHPSSRQPGSRAT
jgi:hypothetical protein